MEAQGVALGPFAKQTPCSLWVLGPQRAAAWLCSCNWPSASSWVRTVPAASLGAARGSWVLWEGVPARGEVWGAGSFSEPPGPRGLHTILNSLPYRPQCSQGYSCFPPRTELGKGWTSQKWGAPMFILFCLSGWARQPELWWPQSSGTSPEEGEYWPSTGRDEPQEPPRGGHSLVWQRPELYFLLVPRLQS